MGQPSPHLRTATRSAAFPQTRKIREPVIACPMGRESLVPQAVASSCPVAGPFVTVPQSRKNLNLATINPVCRESLVAASRCHLRSRCWLLCLYSAKLENFGRAAVDRRSHSACQLILDEKSCRLPRPDPMGAQSKREKTKNDQAGAPISRTKAQAAPGALAPIIAGSFRATSGTARPERTEISVGANRCRSLSWQWSPLCPSRKTENDGRPGWPTAIRPAR